MGWASIGTDTGGSIRIPASACGVVGLKPTFGEIPTVGVVPLSVSLDHVGPLAQNVGDAWAIYDALTGSAPSSVTALRSAACALARLGGYFLEKLDDDVRARFEEALDRLKDAGASIVDVELGGLPDIAATYVNVALPEAFAFHAEALKRAPEEFGRSVREPAGDGRADLARRLRQGARRSRADADGRRHGAVDTAMCSCCRRCRYRRRRSARRPSIVDSVEEPLRPLTLRLTQLFNLTGHPAISLPCGDTREGLPCGLQIGRPPTSRRRSCCRSRSAAKRS